MTDAAAAVPLAQDEQGLREDLTKFYHLVAYFGWDEIIFNHISVRVPGADHHYLVNPFGLSYEEISAEKLIKVDTEGQLVGDSVYQANPAGFALHGAIHANRGDVGCVAHAHTMAMSAVANKADGFSHDNFYGAQLTGRVGYHDFEGITLYADEKERMLQSLGDKDVLVLRNHGVAVCGADVPSTFMLMWIVERAAHVQVLSQSMAGVQIPLSNDVRAKCGADAKRIMSGSNGAARMLFDASVRRMQRDRQG
jgi:ribulose-5-phosphate 4-epimerase/fuculose-1-phosphate aldolase